MWDRCKDGKYLLTFQTEAYGKHISSTQYEKDVINLLLFTCCCDPTHLETTFNVTQLHQTLPQCTLVYAHLNNSFLLVILLPKPLCGDFHNYIFVQPIFFPVGFFFLLFFKLQQIMIYNLSLETVHLLWSSRFFSAKAQKDKVIGPIHKVLPCHPIFWNYSENIRGV